IWPALSRSCCSGHEFHSYKRGQPNTQPDDEGGDESNLAQVGIGLRSPVTPAVKREFSTPPNLCCIQAYLQTCIYFRIFFLTMKYKSRGRHWTTIIAGVE